MSILIFNFLVFSLRNLEIANDDNQNKYACKHCDRLFNDDVIDKHEGICQKIFIQKRKEFDMKKKRILDSEHAKLSKNSEKNKKLEAQKNNKNKGKDPKWKKQSEEFRKMLSGKSGNLFNF